MNAGHHPMARCTAGGAVSHLARHQAHPPACRRGARGATVLEALVALVVLAIGMLGLTVSQARLLADVRSNGQRAVAVNLAEDLANRILINREAALVGSYALPWHGLPAQNNCDTTACSAAAQAQFDLRQWVLAVRAALPVGTATVVQSAADPRQWAIVVVWLASESGTTDSERAARLALLNTSFNGSSGSLSCPSGNHCHLIYVQP